MRVPRLRWVLLLSAIALVAGASAAFGALSDTFSKAPPPLPGHRPVAQLTMTGRTTGAFTGSGPGGTIDVVGLDFQLMSLTDVHTGLPLGKTVCERFNFRKPTDSSTPLLYQAASANEVITRAVFQETGLMITLTNAVIGSVHHVDAGTTGQYEDVALAPQTIEFTWTRTGRTATHECVSRGL